MEMMRLQRELLQLLPASTSSLRKEEEEEKTGKGNEQQQQDKEEPITPLLLASVEKMDGAPHLPRWMFGGVLGEEWVAEDPEGVEGGDGGGVVDSAIVSTDPEDGGGGGLGISSCQGSGLVLSTTNVSMELNRAVPSRGQLGSRHNRTAEVGGGVAITPPRFYKVVEPALHHGELCFKTMGSNSKWVPLSVKPSEPC